MHNPSQQTPTSASLTESIIAALTLVREQKPLVVNITNYVVMNNTANALLAIGASPIMAHSRQEMAEMMHIAGSLVINIGTLDSEWIDRMLFAVEQANANNKPIVLDPVGCGASVLRTQTARTLAAKANNLIIRGNASEIIALAGEASQTKGVDALDSSDTALAAAQVLVSQYHANVVISGEVDYVVTASQTISLSNGHHMMPYVTGMGCSLTALTGAFAAIGETSGLAATAIYAIAGEIAAEQSAGPASLQLNIIDGLYHISAEQICQRLNMDVVA
ncbi:hydroxyethylthiazole kinase [Photobacterium carnosum]|uniref:hydroxyethylthiazole kinase n=1 Tax=Photobacterium carnosum TaxID=2023717 RepID=UPI001E2C9D09|nr:hydroxyethylthiazole kinase [Photobacterium carnosum]MCD9530023.1 hydroxyethylthiazole kinase [Photobacterium carnosum]MCF2152973.1 hydroxyethylthiazole kinase [Photobacterium carnosum]MCF2214733.1 hydroxyethylthiazole kinase [Photobacterium carnosum]